MKRERFAQAVAQHGSFERERKSIGLQKEKTLHHVLKFYIEPEEEKQEVPCLGYCADICNADGITEIQSAGFHRLTGKLAKFLPEYPVTVVYPMIRNQRLFWMHPETGEVIQGRKSTKHMGHADLLGELWGIREFLSHPNLFVRVVETDCDCYRIANGWDASGHKGAEKYELFPTELISDVTYHGKTELGALLSLPETPFTAEQFRKLFHIHGRMAWCAMHTLEFLDIIAESGRDGRKKLYCIRK